MLDTGLLDKSKFGSADNVLAERAHLQFYMHGTGHWLGLDVHDVGGEDWPFVPGVTFNVEPLIQNDQQKIHLRLEDTVLVTDSGSENLTAGAPAELDEIYALIRQPALGAAAR
jgi:Xaa-Pro aminopeptidase